MQLYSIKQMLDTLTFSSAYPLFLFLLPGQLPRSNSLNLKSDSLWFGVYLFNLHLIASTSLANNQPIDDDEQSRRSGIKGEQQHQPLIQSESSKARASSSIGKLNFPFSTLLLLLLWVGAAVTSGLINLLCSWEHLSGPVCLLLRAMMLVVG